MLFVYDCLIEHKILFKCDINKDERSPFKDRKNDIKSRIRSVIVFSLQKTWLSCSHRYVNLLVIYSVKFSQITRNNIRADFENFTFTLTVRLRTTKTRANNIIHIKRRANSHTKLIANIMYDNKSELEIN